LEGLLALCRVRVVNFLTVIEKVTRIGVVRFVSSPQLFLLPLF
jgi:hypothetical protein